MPVQAKADSMEKLQTSPREHWHRLKRLRKPSRYYSGPPQLRYPCQSVLSGYCADFRPEVCSNDTNGQHRAGAKQSRRCWTLGPATGGRFLDMLFLFSYYIFGFLLAYFLQQRSQWRFLFWETPFSRNIERIWVTVWLPCPWTGSSACFLAQL